MSIKPVEDPQSVSTSPERVVTTIIDARPRDLGGLVVRRVLPSMARRMVGPFTFFDEMGAVVFSPAEGVDVRPHPHIGLATVTYLFEGELLHRDSLGSHQLIRPGDVNWMIAGRGIVHSERTPGPRDQETKLHGLQLWVALPQANEDSAPSFHHHPRSTSPERDADGLRLRVLAGSAYGMTSPVEVLSPLFYVEAQMAKGSALALPTEYEERCVYVIEGTLQSGAEVAHAGRMLVFDPKAQVVLRAERETRIVLLGGAALDGKRYIDWNFVSSSQEKIEQAKRDWKEGRFPKVPGDEMEYVPLPGSAS